MDKFDIATKVVGAVTVILAFIGLFKMSLMEVLMPIIIAGTAITFALYIITAFKTKQKGRVLSILLLAAFIAVIVIYNNVL